MRPLLHHQGFTRVSQNKIICAEHQEKKDGSKILEGKEKGDEMYDINVV